MTLLGFIGLLNFVASMALAIVVLRYCQNRKLAYLYSLVNLAICFFSACYFLWQSAQDFSDMAFFFKLTILGVIWINTAFLYFLSESLGETYIPLRLAIISAGMNIFFSVLLLNGHFYLRLEPRFGKGFWPVPTGWFICYLVWWHVELGAAFTGLVRKMRRTSGPIREQLKYTLLAYLCGYIGGMTNWPLWFGINSPAFFNVLISGYCGLFAYAIVKHRVLETHVLIRRTMVYSVLSVCLAAIYVATLAFATKTFEHFYGAASASSTAIAAVVVVILCRPIHSRIQGWLDRHFPRESINPVLLREATGSFAHEIKRPLASISLPIQLTISELEALNTSENNGGLSTAIDRLRFVLKQAHDAGAMIESLRSLSAGVRHMTENTNLVQILVDALESEKELLRKNDVEVRQDFQKSDVRMAADPIQLKVVFANIIRNAVDVMRPMSSRSLTCTLHVKTDRCEIRISDTGPGIPAQDINRLFDPWFSTKGSQGMGIGLFITRQIVLAHEGDITVQSEMGKGTTFHILFKNVTGH